jgi:hypothetical protein
MKIRVYRILGNDLPPRHSPTQTLDNLKFILEHEPEFEGVEKRFLLNRILDEEMVVRLIEQLNQAGRWWLKIPVLREWYWRANSSRERIKYLTNINYARNLCLGSGECKSYCKLIEDT